MSQPVTSNMRIAKNTLMLYLRMLFAMLVGLYTSRVVLATLGVEDYGIYGVVGGIVAMMGFLNASMAGATSRFLTFELGRGNHERLAMIFSSALIIHVGIALVVLVVAETAGLWFLSNKLVIPESRMSAAHWVYQLSIASAMLGITQVPYNATIIAHEKMDVYAYVEILNVTLKLLIVYLLTIGHFDKLILYAWLMFGVSLFIMMLYRIYSIRHFEEARFHWIWDKTYFKPLLSFSGWDLYGNMAWSIRQQGSNFVLNMFYGVVFNAASNVASIVQGTLLGLSSNVIMAFKPQIIKSYATGDFGRMNNLLKFGAKISSVLLLILIIPILVKTEYVLKLWLKIVPDGAVFMTQMSLLMNLFSCFGSVVIIAVHATGKMFKTGVYCGSLYILSIPVMYFMLQCGLDYKSCYIMFVVLTLFYIIINLMILHFQMPQFLAREFLLKAFCPMVVVFFISWVVLRFISDLLDDNIHNIIYTFVFSFVFVFVSMLTFGFDKSEKKIFIKKIKEICLKRR